MAVAAPVGTRFVALTDWYEDALKSQYMSGLRYTVREGNDVLAGLVPVWLAAGKIQLIRGTELRAAVEGKG